MRFGLVAWCFFLCVGVVGCAAEGPDDVDAPVAATAPLAYGPYVSVVPCADAPPYQRTQHESSGATNAQGRTSRTEDVTDNGRGGGSSSRSSDTRFVSYVCAYRATNTSTPGVPTITTSSCPDGSFPIGSAAPLSWWNTRASGVLYVDYHASTRQPDGTTSTAWRTADGSFSRLVRNDLAIPVDYTARFDVKNAEDPDVVLGSRTERFQVPARSCVMVRYAASTYGAAFLDPLDSDGVFVDLSTAPVPQCTSDEQCRDANSCTNDVCQGGFCVHPAKADGSTCDDEPDAKTSDLCCSTVCKHRVISQVSRTIRAHLIDPNNQRAPALPCPIGEMTVTLTGPGGGASADGARYFAQVTAVAPTVGSLPAYCATVPANTAAMMRAFVNAYGGQFDPVTRTLTFARAVTATCAGGTLDLSFNVPATPVTDMNSLSIPASVSLSTSCCRIDSATATLGPISLLSSRDGLDYAIDY